MNSCTQIRRKLVKRQSLNLATGAMADVGQEWVTEPCGAPMFSAVEVKRGTCRSCSSGWTHEHNFPVPDFSSDAFNKQAEREISRSGLIGPRDRN